MKQQTAVEWLYDQLVDTVFQENVTKDILEQAKQMEKEQIIDAFDIACEDEDRIGEEYYYDTYGK